MPSGGEMGLKKVEDHWSFLEEIEAPMWVDLTLEAKFMNLELGDDWFSVSHPFHQCSSRQLKFEFSKHGVGNSNLDVDFQWPSSPKLPTSVSRSRGKYYRSTNLGLINCEVSLDKRKPVKNLSSKTSLVDSRLREERKLESGCGSSRGSCSSKINSVSKSNFSEAFFPNEAKHLSIFGNSKPSSSSTTIITSDGIATSTITSEISAPQQQKSLEVSSHVFDHASGLLSALRINLRKSCVTRQASRVEINDGKHSKGRKSSSGKSSVGSSSTIDIGLRNITCRTFSNQDRTPDSSNVVKMSQAAKNGGKVSTMSQASKVKVEKRTSNSRQGAKTMVAKSVHLEAAKSKNLDRNVHPKALAPLGHNGKDPLKAAVKGKENVGACRFKRLPSSGKENAIGRMDESQKPQSRNTFAGGLVQSQKMTNRVVTTKGERTGLISSKGKVIRRS